MEKIWCSLLPLEITSALALAPMRPKPIARIILKIKVMKFKTRNRVYPANTCCPQRREDELPVYGNLVVTPPQMMAMAEKGIPISSQNIGFQPEDGEKNPSWDLPLDRIKGVDPAAMWEHSQIIKEKARLAHINDRKRFGDGELIKK